MDTSGRSPISIALHLVVLALGIQVAVRIGPRPIRFRMPWAAAALVVAVGIPSLLQFALPGLGAALSRNPDATLLHDGWWRVLSRRLVVWVLSGVCVVIGAVLVAISDAHGVAMLLGAALGVAFGWSRRARSAVAP